MNFEQFKKIVQWVYKTVEEDMEHFRIEDVLQVFSLYFEAYQDFRGEGHPAPSFRQLQEAMLAMPYADEGRTIPLEAAEYETLIPAYFMTKFPNCDYRISHFFSGKIRENRYYETLY